MGRRKTIDRQATLRAIETVVRERGFAALSIDAVAKAAGISKSSVLYDFGSKTALLEAYIDSRLSEWRAGISDRATRHGDAADAWLRGWVDFLREEPTADDLDVATIVASGTGDSKSCRAIIARAVAEDLNRIDTDSPDPRRAILAYLAIHGLQCLEYSGFHAFSSDKRQEIANDIMDLLTASQDPNHPEHSVR